MARLLTWRTVLLPAMLALAACSSQEDLLQQHREKFESLGASTAAIAEAWLGGAVSGTYARTALEQIYQLVEQQRTALAGKPDTVADSRGARLSESAERLSRTLAAMIRDVEQQDASALRRHVTQIPIIPPQQP